MPVSRCFLCYDVFLLTVVLRQSNLWQKKNRPILTIFSALLHNLMYHTQNVMKNIEAMIIT